MQLRVTPGSICGAVLFLALTSFIGCLKSHDEEPEHHAPAHMPTDYPAAVDRLLSLHAEIMGIERRPAGTMDVFTEARDVARWLPMLAADSDLAEGPWNRVREASLRLEAIVDQAARQPSDRRRDTYLQHKSELDQLQRVLVAVRRQFPTETSSMGELR
jgi:hypothetical protein